MTAHAPSRFSRWLDDLLVKRPKLERFASSFGLVVENAVKVPLFRCQRCGECILSHTAFVCSQRCPKRLRNGGCGGTRPGGYCEVYPERRCIWHAIYGRSKLLGRVPLLTEAMPGHRWNYERTSAWLNVFRGRIEPPVLFMKRVIGTLDVRTAERAEREREL
jgi:hypothetical protein